MLPDDVPDYHVGQFVRFKVLPYGVDKPGPYPIIRIRLDQTMGSKYVVVVELSPRDRRAIWSDEIEVVEPPIEQPKEPVSAAYTANPLYGAF